MFVATGVGPFSGQAVHFKHFAPEKVEYAHKRYQYETERHYRILEARLESPAISSAILTRLSTWLPGVGPAWFPSFSATMLGASFPM